MTVGVGTIAYMPPEVMGAFCEGDAPAQVQLDGTKCDIFSYAVLAQYLMTGVMPHDKLSNQQIFVKVSMSAQRTVIPEYFARQENADQEELSDELEKDGAYTSFVHLVERMWAQEPADRPDFEAICKDLTQMFNGTV